MRNQDFWSFAASNCGCLCRERKRADSTVGGISFRTNWHCRLGESESGWGGRSNTWGSPSTRDSLSGNTSRSSDRRSERIVREPEAEPEGPRARVRWLYATVVHSVALYGAPVWAASVTASRPASLRERAIHLQRASLNKVAMAYRDVAAEVACLLSGTLLLDLLAMKRLVLYCEQRLPFFDFWPKFGLFFKF